MDVVWRALRDALILTQYGRNPHNEGVVHNVLPDLLRSAVRQAGLSRRLEQVRNAYKRNAAAMKKIEALGSGFDIEAFPGVPDAVGGAFADLLAPLRLDIDAAKIFRKLMPGIVERAAARQAERIARALDVAESGPAARQPSPSTKRSASRISR